MKKIFTPLLFLISKIYFKIQYLLFNHIVNGKRAWLIFDRSDIPGFGTNLLRTYFPIYASETAKQTFSEEVFAKIEAVIKDNQRIIFEDNIIGQMDQLLQLPVVEKSNKLPYLDNHFFGIFDAAVLGTMIQIYKPLHIVEIGSGISTRYMNYFEQKFGLTIKLTCIDPYPRVEIAQVADEVHNLPLELAIKENAIKLQQGDILFMDGSHYVFQGNDTLTFFFNLLPSVPSGVIIHIHDIYLPYDYDNNVSQQLWSEQYILAAMLMSGLKDFEILYPVYYESRNTPKIIEALKNVDIKLSSSDFKIRKSHKEGYSFWIKKK